jgi:hypothetical protein
VSIHIPLILIVGYQTDQFRNWMAGAKGKSRSNRFDDTPRVRPAAARGRRSRPS